MMSDTESGNLKSKNVNTVKTKNIKLECCCKIFPVIIMLVPCLYLIVITIQIDATTNQIIQVINNTSRLDQNAETKEKKSQENSTMQKIVDDRNFFKIINRTIWGAADSNGQLNRFNEPIRMVIIAHTDTNECNNTESCKIQMSVLQLFYMQLRNFEDIGYNFLIGGDGAVYEGIGWEYIGYHTKGHNDYSIGIGFIGNYQNKMPTDNQMNAAILLLNHGVENNYLTKDYDLVGQRDFLPIVSPGNNIYNQIKKWDHFKKR